MENIYRYEEFLTELVQSDFFQKNSDFYLNKKKDDDYEYDDYGAKKIEDLLKTIDVKDIEIELIEEDEHDIVKFPQIDLAFQVEKTHQKRIVAYLNILYVWKLILAFLIKFHKKQYDFICSREFEQEEINNIFKNIKNYFGLYYKTGHYTFGLFLTEDKNEYIDRIKYCKENKIKILYYNNNVQGGREFFNIGKMESINNANLFKPVKIEDIRFEESMIGQKGKIYFLFFNDQKMDSLYLKMCKNERLCFISAREAQMDEQLFGNDIGHRYHMAVGLPDSLKGIGLGYKLYKVFVKTVGYICSNQQTSNLAKNIYRKFLSDPDFYTIINTNYNMNQKVIIIDKNYQNIKTLLSLVKKREKKEKNNYVYDKDLLKIS